MRSTAEEFLVLPRGIDVGGRLRTITGAGGVGMGRLKLTDVALFDLDIQWGFAERYELDARLTVLPKQPSSTSEPVLQGGSLTLRRALFARTAIALSG